MWETRRREQTIFAVLLLSHRYAGMEEEEEDLPEEQSIYDGNGRRQTFWDAERGGIWSMWTPVKKMTKKGSYWITNSLFWLENARKCLYKMVNPVPPRAAMCISCPDSVAVCVARSAWNFRQGPVKSPDIEHRFILLIREDMNPGFSFSCLVTLLLLFLPPTAQAKPTPKKNPTLPKKAWQKKEMLPKKRWFKKTTTHFWLGKRGAKVFFPKKNFYFSPLWSITLNLSSIGMQK